MEQDDRKSWDHYFLDIAQAVAGRSTCIQRQVGAVIVADRSIVSTGYNGVVAGQPHCTDVGCPRTQQPNGACVAVCAPANALLRAGPRDYDRATMYCTDAPCAVCARLIVNSGVAEVVAARGRHDGWGAIETFLRGCGVLTRLLDGQRARLAAVGS